ncbi:MULTISPECIES: hypothetical protein [unclassified Paenibacillus]|uniref:hypothetical protein n=1 Tax=unclassified Paenibacillus TaxID=185978 RepID=UPI00362A18CE
MKFWEIAGIKYRIGQQGYTKLLFYWFYDWNESWDEKDIQWRMEELNNLLYPPPRRPPLKHWVDTYPHVIHASVLLLDNKIENWKVGQRSKETYEFRGFWKKDRLNDYTSYTISWTVNNSEEHNAVFTKIAPMWFRQWEVASDFNGSVPYGQL